MFDQLKDTTKNNQRFVGWARYLVGVSVHNVARAFSLEGVSLIFFVVGGGGGGRGGGVEGGLMMGD